MNITLIEPTKERTGVVAHQDKFNPAMYNIVKKSIGGRSRGLIIRYNSKTGELITDGATHRRYVSYNHSYEELKTLLEKQII